MIPIRFWDVSRVGILLLGASCAPRAPIMSSEQLPQQRSEVAAGRALRDGYDCDGDGVRDFAIGSPDWPPMVAMDGGGFEHRRGKVVLYSGSTLSPLVTVYGDFIGGRCGSSVEVVGDCDGDGLADLAIIQEDMRDKWCSVGLYSGCTGRLLRRIGREHLPDPQMAIVGAGGHDGSNVECKVLVAQPFAYGPLGLRQGLIAAFDATRLEVLSESYGKHDYAQYGASLTKLHTISGGPDSWATLVSADPNRFTVGIYQGGQITREYLLAEGMQLSNPGCSFSGSVGGKGTVGQRATLACCVVNKGVSGTGRDCLYALDYGSSRSELLASIPTGSDFGLSVGVALGGDGQISAYFVGAPAAQASLGLLYMYRLGGAQLYPTIINSQALSGKFGCRIIELGDYNCDGITDVAVVGEARGEHGFDVVSGMDGSTIASVSPGP